jgi:hypothetical protein
MGFPSTPSNGQTATVNGILYTYSSARTAWVRTSTNDRALFTASNIAPTTPTLGDKWYYIAGDVVYEYINDGTTNYWVDTSGAIYTSNVNTSATLVGETLVAGNIIPTANITYTLGNTTHRWKDLYLSGNTIYLGGATISTNGSNVAITNPAGGSFSVTGSVAGSANVSFGNVFANYYFANGAAFTSSSFGNTEVAAYLRSSNATVGTGAITLPSGTTAQRSANIDGATRINSNFNTLEVYYLGQWANVAYLGQIQATGSNSSLLDGNYKVDIFTASGTWTVQQAPMNGTVEVLMVGGGGAGTGYGGGGGAGEVLTITARNITTGSYPIVVGSGGTTSGSDGSGLGGSGTSTTAFGETAKPGGGGRGADYNSTLPTTSQVANGGGGGSRSAGYAGAVGTSVGAGVTRYGGYTGGSGQNGVNYPGGGGAGAGANGQTPATTGSAGGNGGTGVVVGITGSALYWGGGGGGMVYYSTSSPGNGAYAGNGGAGGGGAGWGEGSRHGTPGAGYNSGGSASGFLGGNGGNNTGGGGGAGAGNGAPAGVPTGGNGGSGIVVIRYRYQ